MMLYFLAIILPTPPAFRRCITAISYTTRSQREQRTGDVQEANLQARRAHDMEAAKTQAANEERRQLWQQRKKNVEQRNLAQTHTSS